MELTVEQKITHQTELTWLLGIMSGQYKLEKVVCYKQMGISDGIYVFELHVGLLFSKLFGKSYTKHIQKIINNAFTIKIQSKIILK